LALLYTDEDKAIGWADHNLGEASKTGFYREERWRRKKDGSLFWARILLTALRDDSGAHIGFSKITLDLTDHKLLERCVKEKEETRRVLSAANAGMWTWHPETGQIDICKNYLRLLEHTGDDTSLPFDQWIGFVHPDQQAQVKEHFDRALAGCPDHPLRMEMQLRQRTGEYRWFSTHANWFQEKADEPYMLQGVSIDIQELKTTANERQQALEKLKEEDARKDEFLAMLAHELRNPLAPVRAAADLLRLARLDAARLQQTSDIIARQVDHMTSLVDDLLDVSRVTRGLIALERKPLDIRSIVRDAVEQVDALILSRRHHLSVRLSPDVTTVTGDSKRLVQIITNLLNNSAKYTHEGGHILLETKAQEGMVLLSVTDDGIGMEPELASHVFELFTQAKRTPDRSAGGLGLGLALVKNLVELQGGTVACFSEGLGKGSTFTVCLPLSSESAEQLKTAQPDRPSTPPQRLYKILVVDDNVDAAATLKMLLEALGHTVFVEHTARQALERALIEPPDICLLDIGLPEIDGIEVAQRMRAQPETARTIIAAVTGYGQKEDEQNAMAAGFDYYLVKPINLSKLSTVLAALP
jgi:signal transduction histidine kinase